MKLRTMIVAAALAATPAQAGRPCLTAPEAESIVLVALPEILRDTGAVCAPRLPSASLLRRVDGPFLAKYQTAADQAWPAARGSIVKLSNPAADLLLDSSYARPLLASVLAPLLVGRIAPADCTMIDHLVTQLAPLPPRNTAGVVVTALQYFNAEKAKGKPVALPDLPFCREDGR